ncbi:hypothetical protein DPMN_124517, partial [Dreissena polymorpha]
ANVGWIEEQYDYRQKNEGYKHSHDFVTESAVNNLRPETDLNCPSILVNVNEAVLSLTAEQSP